MSQTPNEWIMPLPDLEFLPIKDPVKDEFEHRALDHLKSLGYDHTVESLTILGSQAMQWSAHDSSGDPVGRLWIVNRKDTFAFFVVGDNEPNPEVLSIWRASLRVAQAQLGKRQKAEWVAIIAQRPQGTVGPGQRLEYSARIGDLTFRPLDPVRESVIVNVTGSGFGLHNNLFVHWPIEIAGTTSCYSWRDDGELATLQRLRHLTALLSLAWDSDWVLVEGPREAHKLPMSQSHAWQEVTNSYEPLMDIVPPQWLREAEFMLKKRPRLTNSLLIHHEGMDLENHHSSLALVAYIAAIEGIAQINKKAERCPQCRSVLSNRGRFEATARRVLSEVDSQLLADAYRQRSKTVHEGKLHGIEVQLGSWGLMSRFIPDDVTQFSLGTVRIARKASRALLLEAAGYPTPPS